MHYLLNCSCQTRYDFVSIFLPHRVVISRPYINSSLVRHPRTCEFHYVNEWILVWRLHSSPLFRIRCQTYQAKSWSIELLFRENHVILYLQSFYVSIYTRITTTDNRLWQLPNVVLQCWIKTSNFEALILNLVRIQSE